MFNLYVMSGHGAGDSGAVGNGHNEADVVRQISTRLKALGGSNVIELDKTVNWYASNKINTSLKKVVGNNPVIELHLDSAGASAKGGHVIIDSTLAPDKYDTVLANFIKSYFPGRAEVIVKRDNLANPKRAKRAGINYRLLECCFISNSDDMKKLMNDMDAFCRGILSAFGISSNSTPSNPSSVPTPEKPSNTTTSGNAWVRNLQAECNAQGFSKQVVDGIPGKNTLAGCPTVKQGARGGITRLIQQKLNDLGFNCGAVDGSFGPKTKEGVMAFQKAKGLAVDGIVGKNTWRKLLGL